MVPYVVSAVVVVTVRRCGMVSASMGGTHGSGVLSSAGDVLEMSVMRV